MYNVYLTCQAGLGPSTVPCLFFYTHNSNRNIRDNAFTLLVLGLAYTSTSINNSVLVQFGWRTSEPAWPCQNLRPLSWAIAMSVLIPCYVTLIVAMCAIGSSCTVKSMWQLKVMRSVFWAESRTWFHWSECQFLFYAPLFPTSGKRRGSCGMLAEKDPNSNVETKSRLIIGVVWYWDSIGHWIQ